MRAHYVLIDFENVQPVSVERLARDHFRLLVFLGATQRKLPFEFATSLQNLGQRAQYIRASSGGANAVDFHIAYYIGRIAEADVSACFHIVSNDSGFDPLIQHLKANKVSVARVVDIADIPLAETSGPSASAERIEAVIARLNQYKTAKPRSLKTLSSTIHSMFQKQLAEEEIAALIAALQHRGYIAITQGKVAYGLPDQG